LLVIIIRLWGGLGNQLFQYAFAYSIAKENGKKLLLDTRFYEEDYLNKNSHFTVQTAQILGLNLEFNDLLKNVNLTLPMIKILQNRTINRLIRIPKRFKMPISYEYRYCKETRFRFDPKLNTIKNDNLYLDGYWQCEKYFSKYRTELIKQFVNHSKIVEKYIIENQIDTVCNVAIHVRRGDYVNNTRLFSNLYLLDEKYYIGALKYFNLRFENPQFFIFTNDLDWTRKMFINSDNCTFVNVNRKMTDLEEFQIMAKCKHQIISNSTFSWWAAWLNNNSEKIVVAPDKWFGNRDIIPSSWITLPSED